MSNYKGQIIAVLHYINQQIQKNWSASDKNAFNNAVHKDILAKIACMSIRNFQIYFKAYVHETYGAYIDRVRLDYALQLLQDGDFSNAEIAERIGYANDTAFYNALKRKRGYTPSQYKGKLAIPKNSFKLSYKLIELIEKPVLFLSYIGSYDKLLTAVFEEDSWNKLYSYANTHNILPSTEEYWGIAYDNTNITNSNHCRFYACMTISNAFKTKLTDQVKCMIIPSTKYAVYTHQGSYKKLNTFYSLAIQSIPQNYCLSDFPILEHYINSPTNTSTDKLITELYLPIKKIKY